MPAIGSELRTHLKTVAGITALVGAGTAARIYPRNAKQGVSLPYIVYNVLPGEVFTHLTGFTGICNNRIEVTAYAATESGAYDLAELIRLAMGTQKATWGTTYINGVNPDQSFDEGDDPPTKGGNQRRYWAQADYIVTYEQATS
jgi:hypothetical protein